MSVKNFARKDVLTLKPTESVYEALSLMKERNVGSVVVVDAQNKPVGIITDRDIALRVAYRGLDPKAVPVEEVMTKDLSVLDENMGLFEALMFIKDKGVRRYPVVNSEGKLTGFFSLDDVLFLLGKELSAVADIVQKSF